jgi:hypothetical protein
VRVAWSEKGMLAVELVNWVELDVVWCMLDGVCRQCNRMKLLGMSFVESSSVKM